MVVAGAVRCGRESFEVDREVFVPPERGVTPVELSVTLSRERTGRGFCSGLAREDFETCFDAVEFLFGQLLDI